MRIRNPEVAAGTVLMEKGVTHRHKAEPAARSEQLSPVCTSLLGLCQTQSLHQAGSSVTKAGADFMKLQELAKRLDCRLEGNPGIEISGVAGIDHASPGQLTFLANRRYSPLLRTTKASAVLLEEGVGVQREPGLEPLAALRTQNPYLAFAHAIGLFYQAPVYVAGVH